MNAEKLGELLKERGWKIAVAESCTGGLVASKITDVPGASQYFSGGIVAYSNEAKMCILGVNEKTIIEHGAVSKECAEEMVKGVSMLFHTEVAISTTGIAGPSGGTPEKPVGLVYIGFKIKSQVWVERFIFKGDRVSIKEHIADTAIEDLARAIESSK